MIQGEVSPYREPVIEVTVIGSNGELRKVRAIVDTGFNGYLTLSAATIADLNWPLRDTGGFQTGDGREVYFDIYLGQIDWYDRRRKAYVLASGGECLIGTWLLQGSRLTADFLDGGAVTIQAIPSKNST